jgi:methyl-accepting chemotaxis protein
VRKALDAYRHVRDELLEAAQSGRLEHALERGTPLVRQAYRVVKEACAALAA